MIVKDDDDDDDDDVSSKEIEQKRQDRGKGDIR
jgi:hypothetical protein